MTRSTNAASTLAVEVTREAAVITFRRPARLNALNVPTRVHLAQLIRAYGAGHEVRGIVLTGEGRAFSAGEDLQESQGIEGNEKVLAAVETFHDVTRAILETRVPVVAAINGLAVGGASEISLCCDARVGTANSEFFLPENAIGLTISNASSILLRRLVGNHATRLVLASPRVKADEARRIGLLDELVEPNELIERSIDLIHEWTPENGTTAVHLALLRPTHEEIRLAITRENAAAEAAWNSGVLGAGVDRFRARTRPPLPTTTSERLE